MYYGETGCAVRGAFSCASFSGLHIQFVPVAMEFTSVLQAPSRATRPYGLAIPGESVLQRITVRQMACHAPSSRRHRRRSGH